MTIAGFLLGSIPFSALLIKWFKRANIRDYGDGNPGAINAWKAGGWKLGLLSGALDFTKGAATTAVSIYVLGVESWALVPIALAPVAGHAFSPFLKFKGGKALATTFGVWSALTLYEAPVAFGVFLALFYFTVDEDAWAAILAMFCLFLFLLIRIPEGYILTIWAGDFSIVVYKHRKELMRGLHFKPLVSRLARKKS
ncbi:MAG: glycerol-3-phosphate acyltransferase [Actinobacteria bacterium]|nr:glycerol-3-phosphate acyltransferase [Actinomycetota bacterium]